ncbi:MAG: MtrB/PioB family decaheme-associated outer membrane protein [Wenzhouxiangellaceae bacterium]
MNISERILGCLRGPAGSLPRMLASGLMAGMLLAWTVPVMAQDEEDAPAAEESSAPAEASSEPAQPDLSRWQCRNCPLVDGWRGSVLFGVGYVSDDFFEFGNYRGLDDQGVYGALGVDLTYRGEDARYLDIFGERLGLDSRTLSIEGGRQGSYKLSLGWDQITQLRADDTRTPFLGAGTSSQTLPAGWVLAGTTDAMTELESSLQGVKLDRDREILKLGVAFGGKSPWRYRADLERSTRDGNALRGASFIFRAAELAAPIDYRTTRFDAGIGYVKDRWQLEAAYNLSLFENDNRSLQWENPFTGIFGAQLGQLAEPPDNQFHQFMLTGSWNQSRYLSLAGQVAVGRMEQDDRFVQATVNPNLVNPGLPRASFDGEVDTRIVNLRATSNLTRKLRARVQFRYDERDDNSSRDPFTQVITDTFVTGEVVNEPYSFDRTSVEGSLDYRVLSFLNLSASAQRKEMDRALQEVEETTTDIFTLQARTNLFEKLNLRAEYKHENRDNDLDPALLGPGVNPDLRRFHFAEKDRDAFRVSADYALLENLFAGVFVEVADEDFKDVNIGMSDARAESYGLDLSASFSRHFSAHAFVAFENLEADILGADNIDGATWKGSQDDDFTTVGFGFNFHELPGKWVRGSLDLSYAAADGNLEIVKRGIASPDFPQLKTRRFTLEAALERALRENLNLRLGYLVGKLTEDDFFRDNVQPGTVPTLLSLGEQTPDGTVHVVSAMLRYQFR